MGLNKLFGEMGIFFTSKQKIITSGHSHTSRAEKGFFMKRPINNPIQQYEVVEVCPECGAENVMTWDVEKEGYVAYCPHCGSKMMLCDECLHADDAKVCDWCACRGCYREREKCKKETI